MALTASQRVSDGRGELGNDDRDSHPVRASGRETLASTNTVAGQSTFGYYTPSSEKIVIVFRTDSHFQSAWIMPYTINGVGNAYYGKQRVHSIHSTCEFCGAMSVLKSYDTTNYIVVLYIPIIPLGSLRVLSECTSCNKFRCLPLKQWESSKRKAIDEMKRELASDNNSTLPVKKAIRVAIAYQDAPLLDNVANTLGKSMSHDDEVQELLGDAFVYFGRHRDAVEAFKNSLETKPDPLVSDRLALAFMRSGDPTSAAPYAEQALASGDVDRLWVPQLLINSFQGVNDHDQAQTWLSKIANAVPSAVTTQPFQRLQKSVEKGLKKGKPIKDSFLSNQGIEVAQTNKRKFSVYYVVGPVILAALLALFVGVAISKGANHRVILVNALRVPYDVTIAGKHVSLPAGSRRELKLGEGTWDIVPFPDNKIQLKPSKLEIKTSFFARPFSSSIFLVNPDRLGVFVRETTYYAENPANAPQGDAELIAGKSTYQFPSVDFVFEPFPNQLKIEGGSTKRTRLGQETFENSDITKTLGVAMNPDLGIDPMDYIESRIEHFGDADFLVSFLAKTAPDDRFLTFATSLLNDRPVRLNLHREYQNAMRNANQLQPILAQYRERLDGDPASTEWTYLLAHITEDETQADVLWNQLFRAPELPDSVKIGCASRLLSIGKFKEAAKFASGLSRDLPMQPIAQMQLLSILEAAQDYDGVIQFCKEVREPFIDTALQFGVRAVHAKNESNSDSATTAFINNLSSALDVSARLGLATGLFEDKRKSALKAYAAYANKDFAKFESSLRKTSDFHELELVSVNDNFAPYIHSDATKDGPELGWVQSATLALSAHRKGNVSARDSFVADCIKSLEKGEYNERKLAALLSSQERIDVRAFRSMPASPREKCFIAAMLLLQHPDQAAELMQVASLYNYEKSPPFWLLKEILEATKQ